jgi:AcrR family transcriptional regulator
MMYSRCAKQHFERRGVPRRRDGINTEQRVRRAATELFAARGFAATGIRDIADATGVTTAALYGYMQSKNDLLVSVMMHNLERLNLGARRLTSEFDRETERLCALTHLHVTEHALESTAARVGDQEIQALREMGAVEYFEARDAYERIWDETIETGHKKGVFSVDSPRMATLALMPMCTGVVHWYHPTGLLTVDEIADQFADMAMALLRVDRRAAVRARSVVRESEVLASVLEMFGEEQQFGAPVRAATAAS